MAWFFDEVLDACGDAIKILEKGIKTYTKFQKLTNDGNRRPSEGRQESVIADTEPIKAKDITPGESRSKTGGHSAPKGQVIEMEVNSKGCYIPKRAKLDQK